MEMIVTWFYKDMKRIDVWRWNVLVSEGGVGSNQIDISQCLYSGKTVLTSSTYFGYYALYIMKYDHKIQIVAYFVHNS